MATQVLSQTQHAPETAINATQDPSTTITGATSGALGTLDALSSNIGTWAQDLLDRFFPPDQRQALLAKIKAFVLANPKVSAFLGMNIALTGIPLGLFTLFGLSVAVFSVLGGIILGLLAAVFFTLFCVGIALTIVLPILMFTTASACFLFLFGLGGYKILKWASGSEQGDDQANDGGQNGMTIGQGLNSLTGGRLTGLLDSAEAEREKDDIKGFSDENNPPRPPPAQKKSNVDSPDANAIQSPAGKITKRAPQIATPPSSVTKPLKATPLGLAPIAQGKRADEKKAATAVDGE